MSTCRCTHPMHTPAVVVGGRYVVGENPTYRDYEGANDLPSSFAGETVTVTSGPDDDGDVLVENDQSGYWVDPRHLTPAPELAAAPAVDDDLLRDIGELLFEHENRPRAGVGPGPSWQDHARKLLASEPMQRLRAAWVQHDRDERGYGLRDVQEWAAMAERYERERDEARAELENAVATGEQFAIEVERLRQQNKSERQHVDWLVEKEETADRFRAESDRVLGEIGELVDPWMGFDGFITDGVKAVIAEVERLRAELTATNERWNRAYSEAVKDMAVGWKTDVERLRAAQQTGDLEERLWRVLRESAPRPFSDNLVDAVRQLCAQAAQQLPDEDYGAWKRNRYFMVDNLHEVVRSRQEHPFDDFNRGYELGLSWSLLRMGVTEAGSPERETQLKPWLEAHRGDIDAEAADTSSDDEVDQVIADGVSELREHDWPSEELIERVLRRVARRARGGQEADPAVELLKRCAHCQAAWNQKTPHEECYQVEDGGAACCCKEAGRG